MSVLPSVLLWVHSISNSANGNKQVIFSSIAYYYDNDLSYKPSISLHVKMQWEWLAVPDTDSHMTCSTDMDSCMTCSKKYSFL